VTDVASPGRRRWILFAIPQVVLFGGMAVMFVVHPNAITAGVQSTRAVIVNAVLLAGWLLLSWILWRWPRVYLGAMSAAAIVAILVLVVPTLRDTKVVEEFPAAVAEPTTTAPPTSAPTSAGTPAPATDPPTTTVAPVPVRISTGTLRGIGHDATGTASVYERADGTRFVGLEDIDIEPGPDYLVYVVPGLDREGPDDGLELDALRGNQGTQYYEIPSGTDVGPGWTVLVWCRAFGVPIANAGQSS
jgi:Electron transfer DM13